MPQTYSLAELPMSYCNSVQISETDQMGHMNVRFYIQKSWLAICSQLGFLGYNHASQANNPLTLCLRDQHVRFLAEQHPGTPYYFVNGVTEQTAQTLTIYQEMRHRVSDIPAASFTSQLELETQGKPTSWPTSITNDLPHLASLPPHGAPRGLTLTPARAQPKLAETLNKKMINIWLGPVLPELCDADGYLHYWSIMGILSDSIPTLLAILRQKSHNSHQHGGAALEYRLRYYRRVPCHTQVGVYSGLRELGNKTFDWVHWLFDMATGQAFATAQAISVGIDLVARKALPIDAETRAQFEQFCLPDLSV